MVYITSDLHLGHNAIYKYRDRFKTRVEHDRYILDKIKSLSKRDILLVLGDFLFDCVDYEKYIQELSEAKCRIKLVMGNHDSLKLYKEDCVDVQLPLYSYKNMWVSHCPIHTQELRGRLGNIHGHLHLEHVKIGHNQFSGKDKRYFNVNIDVNDYEFVRLETIQEHFNQGG